MKRLGPLPQQAPSFSHMLAVAPPQPVGTCGVNEAASLMILGGLVTKEITIVIFEPSVCRV